ncbi:ATP-binding cassette sub-family C member 5-like [Rhynchocyon petersi]
MAFKKILKLKNIKEKSLGELVNICSNDGQRMFEAAAVEIREEERRILEKAGYFQSITVGVAPIVVVIASVVTFSVHMTLGFDLTAAQVRAPRAERIPPLPNIQNSPKLTPKMKKDKRAARGKKEKVRQLQRTEHQAVLAEQKGHLLLDSDERPSPDEDEGRHIHLGNLRLQRTLYSIDLEIEEMTLLEGSIAVNGTFAYVAQQAWILNATLRDNILFGKEYDEERYNTVLNNCCLRPDLAILPNSDLTEIGERGANLSGGQRQRISLARALYSDRNIYILDDPLSALDAHVGNHIFNTAIRKHLKSKTVLFVTHQLQYLVDCDEVIFMKEGCITERGTHEELMNINGDYAAIFNNLLLGETPPVEINSKKETSGSQKKSQDKGPKTGSVKKEKSVKPEEGQVCLLYAALLPCTFFC